MTIKTSGSLGMAEINSEFGRGYNLNAYRNTIWYTDSGSSGYFSNSNISFAEFYGKRLTQPYRYGTPSGQINTYSNYSYGYVFIFITDGNPYSSWSITHVATNSGAPLLGLVDSGSLDGAGNLSKSYYIASNDPYWFPRGRYNAFEFRQDGVNIGTVYIYTY
jgi:hypothetical protein